jgi:DNA-binding NarL/FixJ family response regulator
VGQSHTAPDTLSQFRELAPDLTIIGARLQGADSISVAEQILAEFPEARIIVGLEALAPRPQNRAIQAGVNGYLLRTSQPDELMMAVRTVLAGHRYLCLEIADSVVLNYRKLLNGAVNLAKPLLTSREQEVLKLTAEGLRVKGIAERLNIGVKTVDTYRSSLFAKLECSSVAELTRYAIREGLVRP